MNIGRQFSKMIDEKSEAEIALIEEDFVKMSDNEFHIFIRKKINEISDEEFEPLKNEEGTANGDLGFTLLNREIEINQLFNIQKH